MNNLVLASTSTEAASLEEARTRLAEIAGTLGTLSNNLVTAAGNPAGHELAQSDQGALVDFAEQELVPMAAALTGAFADATPSPLVNLLAAIAAGHNERVSATTKSLETQELPLHMVLAGGQLLEAATTFIADATELILPELARNTAVSLADALPKRSTTEVESAAQSQAPASGGCACGGHDEPGLSELDTRVIPHAIRHATIFGALEGLAAGKGILLIANHKPLPLLTQLEQRSPGKFTVEFVEDGPELWKLSMIRN